MLLADLLGVPNRTAIVSPTFQQTLLASALGTLVLAAAAPARALSCPPPGLYAPAVGAVGVPTNTRIWCSVDVADEVASVRLYDADGAALSGTQTRLSALQFDLLVFTPDAELAPRSEHRAECPGSGRRSLEFSTGDGPQMRRPPVPIVSEWETHVDAGSGWGPSYFADFPQPSPSSTLILVDVGGGAALEPRSLQGAVADVRSLEREASVEIGYGPCGGNWAEAGLGATTSVALAALDLTGAFSGWSDTITFTLPNAFRVPAPDLLVRVPEAGAATPPGATSVHAGPSARAGTVPLASERRSAGGDARCALPAGVPPGRPGFAGWLLVAAAVVLARRAAQASPSARG